MVFTPKTPASRGLVRPRNFKVAPHALRAGELGRSEFVNMSMNEIRGLFFDKRKIDQAVDRAAYLANSAAAAYLRTTARRSMSWRSRPSTVAGIKDPKQRQRYLAARRAWHRRGGIPNREPKIPYNTSPPGKPPFARRGPGKGLLRKFLFSAVMKDSRNAIIGPVALTGGRARVPALHEYGGATRSGYYRPTTIRLLPRPYMVPARDKVIPLMPQFWRGRVRAPGFR